MPLECSYCGYVCFRPVMVLNPAHSDPCKRCRGTGQRVVSEGIPRSTEPQICYTCGGHGKVPRKV